MYWSEEIALSVGPDLLHNIDLEPHLEILVKTGTSVWDLSPEKRPVGWTRRSLQEWLYSSKPATRWWVLQGREPSLHGSCAQEHSGMLWIIETGLLLSQAMLCRPTTAWSPCGFLRCCCNTDHKDGEWVIELSDLATAFLCAVRAERATSTW